GVSSSRPRAQRSPLRPAEGMHHEPRHFCLLPRIVSLAQQLPSVPALSTPPSLTVEYTRAVPPTRGEGRTD
ncbi:MAG: hypothetical protein ACK53Y_10905, partial [bacterium]